MRIPKGPRWNRFATVRLRDAAWAEQLSFVGTIDEVVEDIIVATRLGANEVLIDLNCTRGSPRRTGCLTPPARSTSGQRVPWLDANRTTRELLGLAAPAEHQSGRWRTTTNSFGQPSVGRIDLVSNTVDNSRNSQENAKANTRSYNAMTIIDEYRTCRPSTHRDAPVPPPTATSGHR
jgi:hypothetical protein